MSDARTIAVYQDQSDRYDAMSISPTERDSLERFISRLPKGAHVLDVGCGPGKHAEVMMAAGLKVTGLDASSRFIEIARGRGVDAHLARFDDLSGFAPFDAVWASFSLLHAPREDVGRHLADIAAGLSDGGLVFLGMKTGTGTARDDLGRSYTYFETQDLIEMLDAVGLSLVEQHTGAAPGLAGTTDPFVLILAHG